MADIILMSLAGIGAMVLLCMAAMVVLIAADVLQMEKRKRRAR